ncbi:MAG: RluA family pseudouridine synthase [Gammaproteobacteria bacterium]|nr:RluA family pseudouridine synthase [Gammaproteobacteria bacterium]
MPTARAEYHIAVDRAGLRALDVLAAHVAISRNALKQAMHKGAVWVSDARGTRRQRRADRPLAAGATLHFYHDPGILAQRPPAARLIADEGRFSVWFKPRGMLSQGSRWGDHCCIDRWAERQLEPQRPAFVTHRLDRAASGLMVLAHGKGDAADLARQFRERQVRKRYVAVVHGCLVGERRIEQPLDDKPAVSIVRTLAIDERAGRSQVEVTIETGRKHQIRRHLAAAGFPIVGDRHHGNAARDDEDLCLTAVSLAFSAPGDATARCYRLPARDWPSLHATRPGTSA